MSYTQARENVAANLKTTLESIDGSDPYYLTSAYVSRDSGDVRKIVSGGWPISQCPGHVIIVNDATAEPRTNEGYTTRVNFTIVGVVYPPADPADEGKLEAMREKWISDTLLAVLGSPRRGGYARHTRLWNAILAADLSERFGLFEAHFTCTIDHSATTP